MHSSPSSTGDVGQKRTANFRYTLCQRCGYEFTAHRKHFTRADDIRGPGCHFSTSEIADTTAIIEEAECDLARYDSVSAVEERLEQHRIYPGDADHLLPYPSRFLVSRSDDGNCIIMLKGSDAYDSDVI